MTTYEMNIDTVNSSLSYYQAEKYIYGSSRLGMLKDSVNVLGSAFGNTDSSNVIHTLGNKRYELSNHLGNVLTVITDKPIPHNNGGTVDYWQASIASAYDYSPFGVMLTGRTFEGKQTICHDSTIQATQNALEEGFGTWGPWTAMADGLVTYVADEMQVSNPSTSKKNIGASKTFTTGEGLHSVSFKVIGNMCSNIVIWPPSSTPIPIQVIVRDNANNIVASGNYTVAGSYNLSFTPASASLTYRIEFYMANASAFCFFRVDDVLVNFEDESVLTVCREVDGFYIRGFNGMERDDIVKGRGRSYTTEFRQYDPRLGRWLSLDPAMMKYPSWSPYNFSFNNPIWWNDPKGDDPDGEPDKITKAASNAVQTIKNKDAQNNPGKTPAMCNIGVNCAFKELTGSDELSNKKANQMFDYMSSSENFQSIDPSEAQDAANNGDIVIGAYKNPTGKSGHVVLVVPGVSDQSGTWDYKPAKSIGGLPKVMDTGFGMRTEKQSVNYSFGKSIQANVVFFKYTPVTNNQISSGKASLPEEIISGPFQLPTVEIVAKGNPSSGLTPLPLKPITL